MRSSVHAIRTECRRVNAGKRHYACFTCRKSFKQPGTSESESLPSRRAFLCPQCRRPMADIGSDFKAPRRRDRDQWAKVEALYAFGYLFRPRCCKGPGTRPRDMRELREVLRSTGFGESEIEPRLALIRRRGTAP